MPRLEDLAGSYLGKCRVREGKEKSLGLVERRRFLKDNQAVPLELRADGTFTFKKTTDGCCECQGDILVFTPLSVGGLTEAEMRQSAQEAGRVFGLAWLFTPFELKVRGESLVTTNEKALLYTEYVRKVG